MQIDEMLAYKITNLLRDADNYGAKFSGKATFNDTAVVVTVEYNERTKKHVVTEVKPWEASEQSAVRIPRT